MVSPLQNKTKIKISFCGKINTAVVASLTHLISAYRINIIDIDMDSLESENVSLNIICQSSSTTDEIDSFWNDVAEISAHMRLIYSHNYL